MHHFMTRNVSRPIVKGVSLIIIVTLSITLTGLGPTVFCAIGVKSLYLYTQGCLSYNIDI